MSPAADPHGPTSDKESNGGKARSADGTFAFGDLQNTAGSPTANNLDFILDVPLEVTVELGRSRMLINDLLKLGQGSIIELGKLAGETLEVLANQKLIARGEVVVVNDKYGIRLTEIISPLERIERLR
jgi:flagellar motor switch protein FliN/FliY